MILPDVNVLVYAFRREAEQHEAYAAWLSEAASRRELGLLDSVVLGLVRLATSARIFADPAPTSAVLEFVDALLAGPRVSA